MEQSLTLGGALVGRQRDLLGARAAVNAALAGAGGLVVITGEAGIGKSALVDELSRGVAAKTLWGVCWDEPGAPAFWPWTAVLTACATATGIEPGAELAPLLGNADLSTGPGLQRRLSLFDSVTRYLGDASAVRPLVVVIEDLHCADEASLDLLRFLATALRGQPVALLGTFRYPDLQPRSPLAESLSEMLRAARTITLYGLDVAAVAELIRSATGREPGGALAGRVYERTAGNPLFVIEVAKLLAAQGNLEADHIPVPPSVRQVIAHRLSYLPAQTLDVLSHASVVGQTFDVALLASLVGDAAATDADRLDEACVAGLARPRIDARGV